MRYARRSAQTEAQQRYDNAELQKQVDQIKPAWTSYMTNFQNKFRIGALAYMDYSFYTHTGFGPQFLENMNPPGPYNNSFNSFDINRVYLNTYFTPTERSDFPLHPGDLSRQRHCDRRQDRRQHRLRSNLDGNLNVRYEVRLRPVQRAAGRHCRSSRAAIRHFRRAAQSAAFRGRKIFTQYRFVYLSPWNYMGLSSSQIGLQFDGPIKLNGSEKTYRRLWLRRVRQRQFPSQEQTDTKQVMATANVLSVRLVVASYQGLGLTGFYNYGYGNVAPDIGSVPICAQGQHRALHANAADSHLRRAGVEYRGRVRLRPERFSVEQSVLGQRSARRVRHGDWHRPDHRAHTPATPVRPALPATPIPTAMGRRPPCIRPT